MFLKIRFINITIILLRKSWRSMEKLSSLQGFPEFPNHKFSEILIFTGKLEFLSLAINTVSLPWNNRLMCSFLRKCLTDTQVCITTIYLAIFLSNKSGVPWKKWLIQLTVHTSMWMLSTGDSHCASVCSRRALDNDTVRVVTQNIRKTCAQGSMYNELKKFYCFINDFLEWYWQCFMTKAQLRKLLWHLVQFEAAALMCAKALAFLICGTSPWWKRRMTPKYCYEEFGLERVWCLLCSVCCVPGTGPSI